MMGMRPCPAGCARPRVDVHDFADESDVTVRRRPWRIAFGGEQVGVFTGHADAGAVLVDEPDDLAVDLADEDHADDLHRLA